MIIDELTLKGYKRFALSGMNGITIRPTKQMQILIGTNGCGKSSFLSELGPLPADPSDFLTGGLKEITIRHNGSVFKLTSSFPTTGAFHLFEMDGVSLNEARGITVQKELVKRYFNLTPEIHDILLGRTLFTNMSPQDRRRHITEMSHNDYSFAMGLYSRFKTIARDKQGAVKELSARITKETNRLHCLGNVDGLEERVALINDELRALLSHRREGIESEPFDPLPLMASLEDDIAFCQSQLVYVPEDKRYRCIEDVELDLDIIQREVDRHEEFRLRYQTEHLEVEDALNKMMHFQSENGETTTLEEAIRSLERRILDNQHQLVTFTNLTDAEQQLKDIRLALPSLVELFQLLPDNSDNRYSKANMEILKGRAAGTSNNRDSLKLHIDRVHYRIEAFTNLQEMTCPSCQYVWKPGFSEHEHQKLISDIERSSEELHRLEDQLAEATEKLGVMDEVAHLYRQFRTLVSAYPRLAPLWDKVMEGKLHLNSPAGSIYIFYQFEHDASIQQTLDELTKEKKDLEELKLNPQASSELGYLHTRLNDLHGRIYTHMEARDNAREDLVRITSYYDKLVSINACLKTIEEKVDIIRSRSSQEIERMRNQHIDKAMATRHAELGSAQSSLNEKIMVTTILDDLQNSHRECEFDAVVYKTLARAMSPTEGVTADQLMAPLRSIMNRMNAIIAKVWTYPMLILPCSTSVDDGELDYKFPIQRPDRSTVTKDISKGSKSQMGIINFAFRLVYMYYTGFTEYPYYLDELEEGFDERHRPALIGLIQLIMETHPTSQLFMVSHYFTMYGSLSAPQVCVLDDANVSVPEVYNEHVSFL
ncbi:MAG TPA: hypothetical protein VN081_02530 [Dongiaceae bacterium]|nr:hypothetical protein [Dongiaceae bacterium]